MSRKVSDRSSVRLNDEPTNHLLRAKGSPISHNDGLSPETFPMRIGGTQAESVIKALTSLERATVATVGRLRLVTGGQLQRLHFGDQPSAPRHARRILTSLTQRRVLARTDRSIGGVHAGSSGFVYRLDVVGQRLIHPELTARKPWTPSASYIAHTVMVSECFVLLSEAAGDRIELAEFQTEPDCWRTFINRSGSRQTLKPDGFTRLGIGEFDDYWFIECDRATEEPARITRKCEAYVRYWRAGREEVVPRVIWVANRRERAIGLSRCIARLPEGERQLFCVCEIGDFITVIGQGAGEVEGSAAEGGGHA